MPGVLLNQWSLSEWNGVLRVASTELPIWSGGPGTESETVVTTLASRAGALVPLGRVGGLGKGERVYAVRFIGDTGYVVTFRQVDPLYVLDLSTPSRPVVRGELKIRGYSAYLHPLGGGLLLGVGQDATDEGRVRRDAGVRSSTSPTRAARSGSTRFSLGKGWSEAEQDHHAFLWWPRTQARRAPAAGVRRHAVRRRPRPADPSARRHRGGRAGRASGTSRASRPSARPGRRSAAPSSSATCSTPSPPPV